MNELYAKLADILEVDEVTPESVLREFENWDSLAALSIIAMVDSVFSVTINGSDLKSTVTAGELERLVLARRRKD